MNSKLKVILVIIMLSILAALLSGCFLRNTYGNVVYVDSISDYVDLILNAVFTNATVAVCRTEDVGYDCRYFIGGIQATSTFYLLSEFGLFGVMIDPVILQVPEGATDILATYDDGSGMQPLVQITRTSFNAQPGVQVTAEAGHKFLILELPPSATSTLPIDDPVNGAAFDFNISYKLTVPKSQASDPVFVKAMLTGKVVVNEHIYYVPLYPCVTDFASVPALEIPQSENLVNLEPALGDLINQSGDMTCFHKVYDFSSAPPPPVKLQLPLVLK